MMTSCSSSSRGNEDCVLTREKVERQENQRLCEASFIEAFISFVREEIS
jgi:hypothetical protein